jgi:hypothetical protein
MLTIRWNDGEAAGTADLLPDYWFYRDGEFGFRQHTVRGVEDSLEKPRCLLTVRGRIADLDYGGEHKAHNEQQWYDTGVIRLTFNDEARTGTPEMTWKDEGDDEFKKYDVTVTRRKTKIKDTAPPFDPKDRRDGRTKIERMVAIRQGQSEFRDSLLAAYEGQCAITGCGVEEVLEAAHIIPFRGDHTNDVTNGLLLRADIHTLFDLGIIKIDRDYSITAPISVRASLNIPAKIMNLPKHEALRPSPEAFEQKWSDEED